MYDADEDNIIDAVTKTFRQSAPGTGTLPRSPEDFDAPELVAYVSEDGTQGRVADMWDTQYNPEEGITGVYVPEADLMAVGNRGESFHHQQLVKALGADNQLRPGVTLVPWATNYALDEWWTEIPQGGGSIVGVVSGLQTPDITIATKRSRPPVIIGDDYLWPIVWAVRRLGIPEEGHIRYTSAPVSRARRAAEEPADSTYRLGEVYDELRFTKAGIPRSVVDRSETVQ